MRSFAVNDFNINAGIRSTMNLKLLLAATKLSSFDVRAHFL